MMPGVRHDDWASDRTTMSLPGSGLENSWMQLLSTTAELASSSNLLADPKDLLPDLMLDLTDPGAAAAAP